MNIWYEVFIDRGQGLGTQTLESFDTVKEAKKFKKIRSKKINKKIEELHIDMWENPQQPNNLKDIE